MYIHCTLYMFHLQGEGGHASSPADPHPSLHQVLPSPLPSGEGTALHEYSVSFSTLSPPSPTSPPCPSLLILPSPPSPPPPPPLPLSLFSLLSSLPPPWFQGPTLSLLGMLSHTVGSLTQEHTRSLSPQVVDLFTTCLDHRARQKEVKPKLYGRSREKLQSKQQKKIWN